MPHWLSTADQDAGFRPSQAALSRLCTRIEEETGLDYPAPKWPELSRRVSALSRELGLESEDACVEWLLDPVHRQRALDWFSTSLTVGETYFFREPEALELCASYARERLEARAPVRIWSAGCCSGEEAYSLAILLWDQWGQPGCAPLRILATDINPQFLAKARSAVYTDWSFRKAPPGFRARYFERAAPRGHTLRKAFRQYVRFSRLNLAKAACGPGNSGAAFDLILCRNVLMYLSAEAKAHAMRLFFESLRDSGLLLVSSTEGLIVDTGRFERYGDSTFAFQKKSPSARSGPARPLGPLPVRLPAVEAVAPSFTDPRRDAPDAPRLFAAGPPAAAAPTVPADAPAEILRLYRDGRHSEALEGCVAYLARDRVNAQAQLLLGLLLREADRVSDARQAYQTALYLDPDCATAHMLLAHLCHAEGEVQRARRHFRNAARLFRAHDPEDTIALLGDMNAGRLAQMAEELAMEACSDD